MHKQDLDDEGSFGVQLPVVSLTMTFIIYAFLDHSSTVLVKLVETSVLVGVNLGEDLENFGTTKRGLSFFETI